MLNDQPVKHVVIAAAPSAFVGEDLVPICFARPENNGIANVEPLSISLVKSGLSADLNGGYGVCIWTDAGRQRIVVRWKDGGQVVVDTTIIIPKKRVLKMNICTVIPKNPPRDAVPVGWALRYEGEKCTG